VDNSLILLQIQIGQADSITIIGATGRLRAAPAFYGGNPDALSNRESRAVLSPIYLNIFA
jgi:hypothetical protein